MRETEMKKLLDKYFDGKTTLREENALGRYFFATAEHDIPAELRVYKDLFAYTNGEKMLIAKSNKTGIKRYLLHASAIAASIALFFFLWVQQHKSVESEFIVMKVGGVVMNDRAIAINKADEKMAKLTSMVNKVNERGERLNDVGRMGCAISSLRKIENIMTQNR